MGRARREAVTTTAEPTARPQEITGKPHLCHATNGAFELQQHKMSMNCCSRIIISLYVF